MLVLRVFVLIVAELPIATLICCLIALRSILEVMGGDRGIFGLQYAWSLWNEAFGVVGVSNFGSFSSLSSTWRVRSCRSSGSLWLLSLSNGSEAVKTIVLKSERYGELGTYGMWKAVSLPIGIMLALKPGVAKGFSGEKLMRSACARLLSSSVVTTEYDASEFMELVELLWLAVLLPLLKIRSLIAVNLLVETIPSYLGHPPGSWV